MTDQTELPLSVERINYWREMPADPDGAFTDDGAVEFQQLCTQAIAAIRLREERDEAKRINETLRAQLHGMQDGALLRDTLALVKRLRDQLTAAMTVVDMVLKEDDDSPIPSLWYSIVAAARAAKDACK